MESGIKGGKKQLRDDTETQYEREKYRKGDERDLKERKRKCKGREERQKGHRDNARLF